MACEGCMARRSPGRKPRRAPRAWVNCGLTWSVVAALALSPGGVSGKGAAGISASQLRRSEAGHGDPSPLKSVQQGVPRALSLASLEQELEDTNVMHKYDRRLERVLMVMPLTEQFNPSVGTFHHGHVQEGDAISLPFTVLKEVMRRNLDVPYQFEIRLVRRPEPFKYETVDVPIPPKEALLGKLKLPQVSCVHCTILDYRSPEMYIFVPDWMMRALRLRPRDLVRLRHAALPKGGQIVLQPHSSKFLKMSRHQAVLETELKHYSSLSRGTTISFKYRGETYLFNVIDCKDADGKSVEAVCVQDSDVATDFAPALDTPEGRRRPRQRPASGPGSKMSRGGTAGEGICEEEEEEEEEDEEEEEEEDEEEEEEEA